MSRTLPVPMGALVLLLGACQSEVGPAANAGGSASAGASSGGTSGQGGASGGTMTSDCSKPQAAAVHLGLLTESQFNHSVQDILHATERQAPGLGQGLDDLALEQRAKAAAEIAAQAAKSLGEWAPCTPPAAGDSAPCAQRIIDEVGAKLYRRPLSESERTAMKALFDAGANEHGFTVGLEWLLTGLLQSPSFVYQVVTPAPEETPGEVRPLAPHEFASRLAYFMWDGPPDDALLAAAAAGQLSEPAQREVHIARMLEDPRFSRGVGQFYSNWLKLSAFREVAREVEGFDESVVSSLSTSLLMSATELYKSAQPNIKGLFTGDTYYLNDALGKFYGVSGTGPSFAPAAMPNQGRSGILTHPALMALLARSDESFPIGRGLFLLRNVVCKIVPALPPNFVPPEPPPLEEGTSTRKRLETHTAAPMCQSCHSMINPAGFAFESFDEVGRFRTLDHGAPVDTSATLDLGMDVDGTYATGQELLAKLGDSRAVRACFTEKYFSFAVARANPDPADACSIRAVATSFAATGDLKQLATLVAGSDSFRMRLAEGVGR